MKIGKYKITLGLDNPFCDCGCGHFIFLGFDWEKGFSYYIIIFNLVIIIENYKAIEEEEFSRRRLYEN